LVKNCGKVGRIVAKKYGGSKSKGGKSRRQEKRGQELWKLKGIENWGLEVGTNGEKE